MSNVIKDKVQKARDFMFTEIRIEGVVARSYNKDEQRAKALPLIKEGMDAENGDAYDLMGQMYATGLKANGNIIPIDYQKAKEHFEQAIKKLPKAVPV